VELHLTAEQEAQLSRIAYQQVGRRTADHRDGLFLLEEDTNSRRAVQRRLADADAGIFIEEDEMDARFEKMICS